MQGVRSLSFPTEERRTGGPIKKFGVAMKRKGTGTAMPRHIVRLIIIMVGFAVLAYGAKQFFTVGSFYQYGHYRGNSVADIASDKPKYKGIAYCASCHAAQIAEWSNGVHNRPDIGKVVRLSLIHISEPTRRTPISYAVFCL